MEKDIFPHALNHYQIAEWFSTLWVFFSLTDNEIPFSHFTRNQRHLDEIKWCNFRDRSISHWLIFTPPTENCLPNSMLQLFFCIRHIYTHFSCFNFLALLWPAASLNWNEFHVLGGRTFFSFVKRVRFSTNVFVSWCQGLSYRNYS